MNLGFPEMLFLFILALLIFGPRKLPEIGRQVGKAMSEFKRASNEFKAQLDSEIRQLELEETARQIKLDDTEKSSPLEGVVSTAEPPPMLEAATSEKATSEVAPSVSGAHDAAHPAPSGSPESSHSASTALNTVEPAAAATAEASGKNV